MITAANTTSLGGGGDCDDGNGKNNKSDNDGPSLNDAGPVITTVQNGATGDVTPKPPPPPRLDGNCYSQDSIIGALNHKGALETTPIAEAEESAKENGDQKVDDFEFSSSKDDNNKAPSAAAEPAAGKKKKASSCCDVRGTCSKQNPAIVAVKKSSCCDSTEVCSKPVAIKPTPAVVAAAKKSSCCDSNGVCSTPKPVAIKPKISAIIPAAKQSSCCDSNGVCDKMMNIFPKKTLTCLAVLRPDNSAIDVFDTKGRSRTFCFNGKQKGTIAEKKLCFSTHGAEGGGIDGMLTPCFDKNGEHDEPDEGCPCGEDEPHLHAHIHDPDICGIIDDNPGCANDAIKKKATSWKFLSQLTLLHLDDGGGSGKGKEGGCTSYMPITESMPKECNSVALQNHLTKRGLKLSHWLRWRNDGKKNQDACCNEEKYCGVSCKSHRLYPVQHEDHTDFLIHNETTGDLHMEHPNCASCGENDIHGRFRLMHTRSWVGDPNNNNNKGQGNKEGSPTRIKLHFFEVHNEPFRLMDVLAGMFDLESSRVHAVRAVVEDTLSRVGRSQFAVEGICCASEIPQVEGILRPIEGVVEISVNPTTRTVYVDHNVDVVSANDIANALNDEGFGAAVKRDAIVAMEQMLVGIPRDIFVNSRFDLTSVLKDINDVDWEKMADAIKSCLEQEFSEEQVKNVTVNEKEKTLSMEHNPYYLTAPGIAEVLAGDLYDVQIISDGGADGKWALSSMKEDAEDTVEHHKSTVRWTVVLSGVFWVISMFSLIGGKWEYLKYVALLSVAFGLPPIAIKAFKTLRRLHFDVNCMMLFAAVGALPLEEYTESAAVTFLFAISEALETRATARARNALSAIVCLRPENANVINPVTKQVVILPANSVAVGTTVSVRTGDKIPCDGVVIEGKSTIDESSLTGESRPVSKSPGLRVSGGTMNTGNTQLVIKTTATANNSAVARLIKLVEEAQSNRSETEKMVDSFAKIYTPIVVLVALCMCTIPWAFGTETGQLWAKNGLITIVIACPCALIISTPVTYVAGLAAAAQKGVIIKGGQHLEGLGRVKSIYFDKTGTLSQGLFVLLHFNVIGQTRSRKEVLGILALIEAPASHPLSDAIVNGAANEQNEVPKMKLENHTLLPGEGITANVEGMVVHVGNNRLFQRLGLYDNLPENVKITTEKWANSGGTTGFISIDGEIVGAYCVADKIRDEAKDVVAALKQMGIEITMITGDQRPSAIGIGGQIGLNENDIRSEQLPQDKLLEIGNKVKDNHKNKKFLKAKRAVMMVGDGVNDAPALALADVSVAMGEGAALAMETADVTLMDSNLNKLLYSVRMGRRVVNTIVENVAFSLIVKAIVMGFTFAGKASLWAAIATDVGAMLIVTINGMKLLPSSKKVKENDLALAGP